MFSYEDRLRAVQFYVKLGKRVGLTIRQPGFPTKNTLKHWYQEYKQGLGLATGYQFAGAAGYLPAVESLDAGDSSAGHPSPCGRLTGVYSRRSSRGFVRRSK